jgi:stringent starvation protein B
MMSNRPYLLRALHEWIVDNGLTPQVLVDANFPGLDAPMETAKQDKLVLNIGPTAVSGLELGSEWILFSARFAGIARDVAVPVEAVLAIYARENGHGMMFAEEDSPPPGDEAGRARIRKRQHRLALTSKLSSKCPLPISPVGRELFDHQTVCCFK